MYRGLGSLICLPPPQPRCAEAVPWQQTEASSRTSRDASSGRVGAHELLRHIIHHMVHILSHCTPSRAPHADLAGVERNRRRASLGTLHFTAHSCCTSRRPAKQVDLAEVGSCARPSNISPPYTAQSMQNQERAPCPNGLGNGRVHLHSCASNAMTRKLSFGGGGAQLSTRPTCAPPCPLEGCTPPAGLGETAGREGGASLSGRPGSKDEVPCEGRVVTQSLQFQPQT
jgi:hypothetical protein